MHNFRSVQKCTYRSPNEGLHTLLKRVSPGAIHDSAKRCPPSNCHPVTRKAVRQIISDWIHDETKDLGDMPRFLPGVVVRNYMTMKGMADLYRIKPDLLKCITKSTIEPLKLSHSHCYILDGYLSDFLQDRDRSQLNCDPMLQHISICRHLLSLIDGSNVFDLQSS